MIQFALLLAFTAAMPQKDPEVIIVGAGWAGMSAAHVLAKANVSFIVVEARNYTGGRTHSIQFGDPSVGVHTMEVGSGWLESSGIATGKGPEPGPPPLVAIADQMTPPLKRSFIPGSSQNQSNYKHVYLVDGKEGDPDGKVRAAANTAYDCLQKLAKKTKTKDDITVRAAFTKCGWAPKTPVDHAVDWAVTVDDPGMLPEVQSLLDTLPDPVYTWWGPDDHFIIDQRPRGYAGVLDQMVKDTVPPGDKRVIFNTKVKNVAYDTDGVTVTSTDGQTYKSKVAITTFPLGVLNRHHKDLFTPHVPKKLAKILDGGKFIMSNLTRIYIQFPSVFWDNDAEAFLAAVPAGVSPGELPEFQNLNHKDRTPGSNTLLLFIGNPESIKYENMQDGDVSAAVVRRLEQIFPDKTVPKPSAFYMTRWGLDPLAYGCYSALMPGFDDDSYSKITAPLEDSNGGERVYMGGEAMCDDLSGSTYGGHQSGRQIAELYLHKTKRGKKPLDICWY